MRLDTKRLTIRGFVSSDLLPVHRILCESFGMVERINDPVEIEKRRSWLEWSRLNDEWFPKMDQLPYGDRVITLQSTGEVVGVIGYVPLLDRYAQLPELAWIGSTPELNYAELGLFWAVDPARQRQGFATEAAQAMVDYAFARLQVWRVLATTEYDNLPSQAVMVKLGMTLARNPLPEPPWLQVVGVLENPWISRKAI